MRKLVFVLLFLWVGFSMGKELSITSLDGYKLVGFIDYPEEKKDKYPLVVFAHQFGTTHVIWSEFAKELRKRGFATLLVDLRGHGLSIYQNGKENKIIFKQNFTSILDLINFFKKSSEKVKFEKIPEDLSLWIDYVIESEKIDPDNIILIGASLGGISVIPVVTVQDIKAVVSISPGSVSVVGEDTVNIALASYTNPILYVVSVKDPLGSKKTVDNLLEKTNKGLSITTTGSGHGVILLPKVKEYIFTFLNDVIKGEK
jgi:dienelactone hydrolase